MSLGDAIEKIGGDAFQTIAAQANNKIIEATSKAAYDKALTLGEQIANYTCNELNDRIPPMITSTTNEIIKQLTAKIDSEKFTTDFINVLQTKLLDANSPYSEKFLNKFDELFDRIINNAEKKRRDKEKEEQQGYNSMSQDTKTIIYQLKAENADLKKSLSMYIDDIELEESDIELEESEIQGRANNGSTTTGKEIDTDDENTTERLGQQVSPSGVSKKVVTPVDQEYASYNLTRGNLTTGRGRRKHSKKKRNQKKPTKQTKRVRFSTKK
jgi:hypothetical protein